APVALGVHAAQVSARGVSTLTTAGLGNPVLSLAEEIAAVGNAVLAMAAPILVPVVLILAVSGGYLVRRRLRSRKGAGADRAA
ncbi:DUF4126 domain-containing protein, partial [Mycobacterium tuberculosis]